MPSPHNKRSLDAHEEQPAKRRRYGRVGRDGASAVLSHYAVNLSDEQKTKILRFLLETTLRRATSKEISEIARDHKIQPNHETLRQLERHKCSWHCLIRRADALCVDEGLGDDEFDPSREYANTISVEEKTECLRHILLNRLQDADYNRVLSLARDHGIVVRLDDADAMSATLWALTEHNCSPGCLIRADDARDARLSSKAYDKKQQRHRDIQENAKKEEADVEYWKYNWPQVEDELSLHEIMQEFLDATSGDALRKHPCSFCNANEPESQMRIKQQTELDITLLSHATEKLRSLTGQTLIQSHQLFDDEYHVCATCWACVKGGSFIRLPTLSWANGCWIGSVPKELEGLTYAEELVIARAHATKCWAKLNGNRQSTGQSTQRSASGNVCLHPHEITRIATHLPRPINSLYDEIIVIFVTEDRQATADMFKRTPLLVRRGYILRAIQWLKANNPLYSDVEIDWQALAEYPDDDSGRVPYPVQFQTPNSTISGQSATYTGHGVDTTEAIFAEHQGLEDKEIPISVTGTFDVDRTEAALSIRKLEALKYLKNNNTFLKTSTSNDTINTRNNPSAYGMLWPTLFPYGVGMFEDPIRQTETFRDISLYRHVRHCLRIADRRFQTHLSFIFVMHNILMLRRSAYKSRLAVRRAWWPAAMEAMKKIDTTVLQNIKDAMLDRKARKDFGTYEAKNDAEKAVLDVLKYVEYVDDHIEGSTAEVTKMREEMRALSRQSGTPSIFFTLNPADAHNPITSFLAGHDIDIDAPFCNPDSRYTPFHRARTLAGNPVAGAEFFYTIASQYINTLLGFQRRNRRGVFGRVKHYYGVVEAQNRGSLHLRILIWLEGALSPKQIQERCAQDEPFKQRLFRWLENSFWHSLPPRTRSVEGKYEEQKKCLLGRPPYPKSSNFDVVYPQYLREVLDASGQQHRHSDCCYKKTSRSFGSLTKEEQDMLCRFNLPAEVVDETFIDENGKIHIKRLDGTMAGYNPTVTATCQCNTDGKFVGSGALGMALSIYMTNYTAKSSLDSAVVISALAAAVSSLQASQDGISLSHDEEACRRLLLKTLNQINGRRELSAQQVASSLMGNPNHLTDSRFTMFYWSKLLHWLSPSHFPFLKKSDDGVNSDVGDDERTDQDPDDDDLIILNVDDIVPPIVSLAYDILYRPLELEGMCMWDIMCQYEKCTKKKRKDDYSDDSNNVQDDDVPLQFLAEHPQAVTHEMRKRSKLHVPVLIGRPVPRRDLEDQSEQYSIVILALFRPWTRDALHPLKPTHQTWHEARDDLLQAVSPCHLDIMDHMQEQWECRLAADDYSAKLKQKESFMATTRPSEELPVDDEINDLQWQLGQEDVGGYYDDISRDVEDITGTHDLSFTEDNGERSAVATDTVISMAKSARLYATPARNDIHTEVDTLSLRDVGTDHRTLGQEAAASLAAERTAFIERRNRNQTASQTMCPDAPHSSNKTRRDLESRLTTLDNEKAIAKSRMHTRTGSNSMWEQLETWQQIAIGICRMFTLNRKQRLAFLIIVNDQMIGLTTPDKPPLRLIIGGPGGTGKSHIYNALKMFQSAISRPHDIVFTAPTGVAAANIGGSTVYSELSLSTKYDTLLKPNSKTLPKLIDRLSLVRTIVLDEFFFMGCGEFEKISRFINLARRCIDDPFGYFNFIISGDQFQLSGPKITPLFSHVMDSVLSSASSLQALSDNSRRTLTGFKNYRTFDKCIVLDTIVRQQNPRFIAMLNRLRRGLCSTQGPDNDLDYLKTFRIAVDTPPPAEPDVTKWVTDPDNAPPLITYTNSVRNAHNWNMTAAFATSTNQDFVVYYAEDTVGKGSKRTVLTGLNARDAWNTTIKTNAHDLSGRLPLAIGMPVIVVDNLAVELGVCNGSRGILRHINYFTKNGRRYAVSADVDIPAYSNPDPNAIHPHRVTIPTVVKTIQYTSRTTGNSHSARRQQLPLIAGFAFTVHNSQSQSLNAAIIHLESSRNIASSYVMLSRIKCGVERPTGLQILGDVTAAQISVHAPQEVRQEEKRLLAMSEMTIENASKDLRWYVETGEEF